MDILIKGHWRNEMSRFRILIIEDEAHIIELIKFNLESNGFEVITAMDGLTGLKTIEQEKPDLVLLDLMLPQMDGIEVCKNAKMNPEIKEIPIIMLTARGSEMDKVLGLEIGADDYMTKPFSIRELIARIKVVLRRSNKETPQIDNSVLAIGDLEIIKDLSRKQG